MNRLTVKCNNKIGYGYKEYSSEGSIAITQKLGQLEDIEELCEKIIEKPIYEKFVDSGNIHEVDYTECCALYSFKHNRIELYMYDFVNYLELDQYGKTWALTKEELL